MTAKKTPAKKKAVPKTTTVHVHHKPQVAAAPYPAPENPTITPYKESYWAEWGKGMMGVWEKDTQGSWQKVGETPILDVGQRTKRRRQSVFLYYFGIHGTAQAALDRTHTWRTVYELWKNKDRDFAEAFELALDEHNERLEEESRRRGQDGVVDPVYQGGKLVGYKRQYSDTLLIFRMKGQMPNKYKDRVQQDTNVTGKIEINISAADENL